MTSVISNNMNQGSTVAHADVLGTISALDKFVNDNDELFGQYLVLDRNAWSTDEAHARKHGRVLCLDFNAGGQYKYDMVDVEIDEDMLKQVADMTGGKYFRATDEKKLGVIYQEIDKLEKTRERVTKYSRRNEEYFPTLLVGCCLLALALLLDNVFLRINP